VQSATVVYVPGAPFTVTVQASPTIIVADGSTSTITATVTDRYSNPVIDGTSVIRRINLY